MSDNILRIRTKYSSEPGVPIGELFGVSLSKEEVVQFNTFLQVSRRTENDDILSEADILSWLLLQEGLESCDDPDSLRQNRCKLELLCQDPYKYRWDDEKFKKLPSAKQKELRQNAASFLEEAQKFIASKATAIGKTRQEEAKRAK